MAARASTPISRLFTDEKVQRLLMRLTGAPEFHKRRAKISMRPYYALMTDATIEETTSKVKRRSRHFQQLVPVMEPRSEECTLLSVDEELKDFDRAKFVFTDITFDSTNQERVIVVREADGMLRTANPEEHDRMNRIYYPQKDKPVFEPAVFSDPHLTDALKRDQHEFVLDWACYYFEPNNSRYTEICQQVYDHVAKNDKFHLLYPTRHFGSLVFYACIEENDSEVDKLLDYFGRIENLEAAANLIRLKSVVAGGDGGNKDDYTLVKEYVVARKDKSNERFSNLEKLNSS